MSKIGLICMLTALAPFSWSQTLSKEVASTSGIFTLEVSTIESELGERTFYREGMIPIFVVLSRKEGQLSSRMLRTDCYKDIKIVVKDPKEKAMAPPQVAGHKSKNLLQEDVGDSFNGAWILRLDSKLATGSYTVQAQIGPLKSDPLTFDLRDAKTVDHKAARLRATLTAMREDGRFAELSKLAQQFIAKHSPSSEIKADLLQAAGLAERDSGNLADAAKLFRQMYIAQELPENGVMVRTVHKMQKRTYWVQLPQASKEELLKNHIRIPQGMPIVIHAGMKLASVQPYPDWHLHLHPQLSTKATAPKSASLRLSRLDLEESKRMMQIQGGKCRSTWILPTSLLPRGIYTFRMRSTPSYTIEITSSRDIKEKASVVIGKAMAAYADGLYKEALTHSRKAVTMRGNRVSDGKGNYALRIAANAHRALGQEKEARRAEVQLRE